MKTYETSSPRQLGLTGRKTEDDKDRPKDEAPQLKIEIPANR